MSLQTSRLEKLENKVILYNNETGSTSNITLLDSVKNYSAIEIVYGCDGYYFNKKILDPNNKNIGLMTHYTSESNENLFLYTSSWQIIDNHINFLIASNKYLTENNVVSSYGANSYIRIYKVVAYK